MNERPLRLTDEIPLDELGVSCIYCGHVVGDKSGIGVGPNLAVAFVDALRHGIELNAHLSCARALTTEQLASAAAIRTCSQMNRGYYLPRDMEMNIHGPMFERALKETTMSNIGFFSEHWYDEQNRPAGGVSSGRGFTISWQNGPLGRGDQRRAPNGAFVEDVLAACRDRLMVYQMSEFACDENADAIAHVQNALQRLEERTRRRVRDGVEGTHAR